LIRQSLEKAMTALFGEQVREHPDVSAETSRRMACDASVVHWRETSDGEPLNIGRKTRSIPPAIRRALSRRDGGCRFPGCNCRKFVDAHHTIEESITRAPWIGLSLGHLKSSKIDMDPQE